MLLFYLPLSPRDPKWDIDILAGSVLGLALDAPSALLKYGHQGHLPRACESPFSLKVKVEEKLIQQKQASELHRMPSESF